VRPAGTAGRKDGLIASYHFSVQIIGRAEGRSAIAAAAYRAGARLYDSQNGRVADYRRRRGVGHTEILLPEGSASWLADRERLWNAVEAMERRIDAQLAREINLALPHELSDTQRLALLRGFVREQFVARGMVADIALHHPVQEKGDDPRNFHAHILLTLRQATAEGLRAVKTREWNSDGCLLAWRQAWAEHQNRWLRLHAPQAEPVDARALTAQREAARQRGDRVSAIRLDRMPELHVGVAASHAARRGRRPAQSGENKDGHRQLRRRVAVRPRPDRVVLNRSARRDSARRIRYDSFGTASRFEANGRRLACNCARYDATIRRWQRRSALFANTLHQRRRSVSSQGRIERQSWGRIALLQRLIALIEVVLAALLAEHSRQRRRLDSLHRSIGFGLRHPTQRRGRGRRRGPAGPGRPRRAGD